MPNSIHTALVEGLNTFVAMIVAPINARLDALEGRAQTPALSETDIRRMIDERVRASIQDEIDNRVDERVDERVNELVSERVPDAVNDALENVTFQMARRR